MNNYNNLRKKIVLMIISLFVFSVLLPLANAGMVVNRVKADSCIVERDGKNFVYVKANESRLSAVPVVCNDEVNLVPNPSFEEGSGVYPDSWATVYNKSLYYKYYFWDSRCAFSGSKSIGFKDYIDDHPGNNNFSWSCRNYIPIHPDEHEYKLSIHYKYSQDIDYGHGPYFQGLYINLFYYTICGGNAISSARVELPDAGLDWEYYSVNDEELDIPKNCLYARIRIVLNTGNLPSDNEIAFDDVFFGPVNVDPDSPPNNPVLSGASSVMRLRPYSLKVSVSDPDDDQLYIHVMWGDNGGHYEDYGPYSSGTTVELTHTYKYGGKEYIIEVSASDEFGMSSNWVEKSLFVKSRNRFCNVFENIFYKLINNLNLFFPFS